MNGSISPATDLSYTLGSATKRWKVYHDVGARVYNSGSISIPNGTAPILTFNSERYDSNGLHSTSVNTSRLTAPSAGIYIIGAATAFAANATGMRSIAIRINGTTFIAGNTTPAASGEQSMIVVSAWSMAIGDYAETTAYQNSGGALNVLPSASYSPEFWMQLISAK
jgi:hypothetical protein